MIAVSVGCASVCGTRGSGIVSSADDALEMSVERGVRGVGGVCEMCTRIHVHRRCTQY